MSDRNEWFKDVKRLVQSLEVETVENPFAWPTGRQARALVSGK